MTGLCCGLLLSLAPALAQQAVPALTGRVMDTTHTLSAEQLRQLESKLAAFEQSAGAQIVLLLVPTTQPEDIASYANRVTNVWEIGRKEIGDGLLLLVAKDDHKVRIEVAKTLEGAVPDLAAKRIIDQAIAPRFKQNDFAGGLDAGVEQIMKLVSGEALPAPPSESRRNKSGFGFDWMDLAIFAFFAVPIVGALTRAVLGPKLGALATGGTVGALALFITSSLLIAGLAGVAALLFALFSNVTRGGGWGSGHSGGGWGTGGGGFSSGSGGGGGFSSGGGGDFGGGGASGDW
ncbi:MAG: TPM domain-containing protein [Rhodoferax sp.]|uniref:TPM domain-containing protein n=1 Tax=Rhodoferax sp. TaxID=50421 RepID=UPI00262EE767|nr:TPM domain-containing protein [Rhodoferax sp.]MDD5332638.1 TPM domain-containing protein [Rhodoferax sp.]